MTLLLRYRVAILAWQRDNYVQKDPKGSNTCYILLIPADLGFWTLGQIFINKYYTGACVI